MHIQDLQNKINELEVLALETENPDTYRELTNKATELKREMYKQIDLESFGVHHVPQNAGGGMWVRTSEGDKFIQ